MNGYYFAEHLLLRAPARNWREYFVNEQTQLDDQFLQAAIYIASPQFYECLKQKQFTVESLSSKERLTLRKYINRSCFRAIPFGLFAGVSLIQWGEHYKVDLPKIKPSNVNIFPDQGWVTALSSDLRRQEFNENCRYETNPTLYKLLNEYRFVSSEVEPGGTKRKYLLQSIDYSLILQELAQFCRTARYASEVVSKICQLAGCSDIIGADYFSFLRVEQFLAEERRPTITGAEHIGSLLALPEFSASKSVRTDLLWKHFAQLKTVSSLEPEYFKEINGQFNELAAGIPDVGNYNNNLYVILNRPLADGSVPFIYQEYLREALFALDCLQNNELVPAMDQFVRRFQKHFDGQTLDLLYALDPEVGIGYYAEENPANLLLETLQFAGSEDKDNQFSWTDAQRFLLEKWHSSDFSRRSVISIEEHELRAIKPVQKDNTVLGLSVLFRVAGQQIYLESAGGVNAPALLGRFTLADDEIKGAARKMAREMEAANPDVIFAEILHLSGTHTDNINRRETIWSYEIPVTAASTLPTERQISLNDLRLKVMNGSIVLFSEKHGKIIIPRLTSAYNHTIDKLPLFRFLVDVSYQQGQFSLGLDLRQYFPGLTYYPRVTYKQSVLFLATWVLTENQIKEIVAEDLQSEKHAFSPILDNLGLPKVYSLMEGDQQLVFFRDEPNDMQFFRDCIRQKQEVVVKEFLLDYDDDLMKQYPDPSFVHQYNAFILPAEPLGLASPGIPIIPRKNTVRRMMPGSEWLYLKIYTSRNSSSKLLLKIMPLLRRRYAGRKIQSWFFVRYEDHAPHIRLRIQMAPEDISLLLIAFRKALENGVSQHVVREYQIDVYNRELERYHAAGIGLSENFFWISSELAVRFLKLQEQQPALPVHELTIRSVWDIIAAFLPALQDRLSFVERSYLQYLAEFDHKNLKVELDQKYRELTPVIRQILAEEDYYSSKGLFQPGRRFIRSVNNLAVSVAPEDPQREEFLQSVIHMHLNRFFVTEPRMQELIVYFMLYRYLVSTIARSRKKS